MTGTGVADVDQAAVWSVTLGAIAGGAALLWRLTRGARRVIGRLEDFADDWHGVPARPGVPERPGVMARLDRIEHELHPNSGSSLRDAVNRIEDVLAQK